MNGMRLAASTAFVALCLALGACSSPKGTRAASPGAAGGSDAIAAGGGYYLDDGPGRLSPADVAAIPDAVPRAEPVLLRTARPYTVFGRTYTPMTVRAPYRERGTASWYGRRYHGKPTSSGEPYDMYAMTAAHPTLPIPSYVRVTRVADGRSVVVRVNDRGPFLQNRLIDLSYTAAAKLGFVEAGSAEVEVEAITRFDERGATVLAAAEGTDAPQGAASDVALGLAAAEPVADDPVRGIATASADASAAAVSTASSTASSSSVDPSVATAGPPAAPARLVVETSFADGARPAGAASQPAYDPSPAGRPGFWLQFGAFASADGARAALERLRRELAWLGAGFDLRYEGGLYKVQAGPWPQREHALKAAARVRAASAVQPFPIFR